jgi:hypothetical protein
MAFVSSPSPAQAQPGVTTPKAFPLSVIAGSWEEARGRNAGGVCNPNVLQLRMLPAGQVESAPVSASLAQPSCLAPRRVALARQQDSARRWYGMTLRQSGRILVVLRPDAAADTNPQNESLTLWLSANGCELGGIEKSNGRLRVAIYRSRAQGCAAGSARG